MLFASVFLAGLTAVHSLRVRGVRATLTFAALGLGVASAGEFLAVHVTRVVRHHARSQLAGIPVSVLLGWVSITYAAFAAAESILGRRSALGTALLATSLDLVLDPYGLDRGQWEWRSDGAFATDVHGPNGRRGVPILNFVGWLAMTGAISHIHARLAPSPASGSRLSALLLLPYYVPAAAWAMRSGRPRLMLYSALVPLAVLASARQTRAACGAIRQRP